MYLNCVRAQLRDFFSPVVVYAVEYLYLVRSLTVILSAAWHVQECGGVGTLRRSLQGDTRWSGDPLLQLRKGLHLPELSEMRFALWSGRIWDLDEMSHRRDQVS